MNLELTLLELNELYLATQRLVNQYETEAKEYGGDYMKSLHERSILLRDKIQTALHDECTKLDEAREWVSKYKAEQYDRERDILKNAIDEEVEPEYDSAGFTEDDRIVNGQYRVISNEDADEDAKQRDYSAFNDYAATINQDEQRYADSMNEAQSEDRKLGNI